MHFNFYASLALVLLAGGCSSSKSLDEGSDEANADEATYPAAAPNEPSRARRTAEPSPVTEPSKLEQAQAALAAGEPQAAAELVRQYLLAHPHDVPALFLAARIQAADGHYLDAVALLDEIPRDHPEAGLAALGQSADWMLAAEQWDEAEGRYKALLEKVPTANMAHHRLAYLLNRQGRRQEASKHVRQLCRAGDVSQSELHTLINQCEAIYDEARDEKGSGSEFAPIGPQAEARVLFSKNKFKLAIDRLRKPMRQGTLRPSGQAFFGRLATEAEDHQAIALWVRSLTDQQQQFGDYWVALATLMQRDGSDIEGAARAFCEAIVRNPTDRVAMARLENCMSLLGDSEQEVACRQRWQLLNKTFLLNQRIVGKQEPDPQDIARLAGTLEKLHRPIEATMWRAIGLSYEGASQEAFKQIKTRHRKLVNEVPYSIRPIDALAGLQLTRFPLPTEFYEKLKTKTWTTERTAESELPPASVSVFPNLANAVGIDFQYFNASDPKLADLQLYEQFGGGVATFDYDLDGRVDLYFNQGGADPKAPSRTKRNSLFRNIGEGFVNIRDSEAKDDGYGQGVTSGDWNQDGFPDLVVANFKTNSLLINNGDGTFRRSQPGDSWNTPYWTTSVAIADITGDALPEIIEVNYVDDPDVHVVPPRGANGRYKNPLGPESLDAAVDRVFVNRGDGSMEAVRLGETNQVAAGHGLGVVVTDIDGEGGNEVFIANDTDANHLWAPAEESGGQSVRFLNHAVIRGCAYTAQGVSGASMGIATGDFDRNGTIDFHVTNFYEEPVHLYLQDEKQLFSDSAIKSDLFQPSFHVVGFGTEALDYDNNGTLDLAVVNGHIDDFQYKGVPHKMTPQIFTGNEGRFAEVRVDESIDYWKRPAIGRALLTLDWNRDGRMDLVATHHDAPAALLENRTESKNNWIQLRLVGTASERDAIGARVTIHASGQQWLAAVTAGDGYVCKNESIVAFGLGSNNRIDRLTVQWPSGMTQEFTSPTVNQRYLIIEDQSDVFLDQRLP